MKGNVELDIFALCRKLQICIKISLLYSNKSCWKSHSDKCIAKMLSHSRKKIMLWRLDIKENSS